MSRFSIRGRVRLRARIEALRNTVLAHLDSRWTERAKVHDELQFWVCQWDSTLRAGRFWNSDIRELLEPLGEWPGDSQVVSSDYPSIRWLEARAHGMRILKETGIAEPDFFRDKLVVDIGPGAVCFLEASGARLGVAVEPLAAQLQENNLLLSSRNTIYLPVGAESIPLLSNSVDVVVSRNNLDHVSRPSRVVEEVARILRPGGVFLLIVHLEPERTVTEPNPLNESQIRTMTAQLRTERELVTPGGRTSRGRTLAATYRKLQAT